MPAAGFFLSIKIGTASGWMIACPQSAQFKAKLSMFYITPCANLHPNPCTVWLLCMPPILLHRHAWSPTKLNTEKGHRGIDGALLRTMTFEPESVCFIKCSIFPGGNAGDLDEGCVLKIVRSADVPNLWQDKHGWPQDYSAGTRFGCWGCCSQVVGLPSSTTHWTKLCTHTHPDLFKTLLTNALWV